MSVIVSSQSHRWLLAFLAALLLCVAYVQTETTTEAQPGDACPALVERALAELQANCEETGRNSACYGYNQVDSTFSVEVEPGFFSQPSDKAGLVDLSSIETAPLDVDTDRWGIALMNAQANVPNTLPGQAVTFILMGDSSVENRVSAQEAFIATNPVDIIVRGDAVLRSHPTRTSNTIDILPLETTLQADAVDPTGEWVRSLYDERIVWIAIDDITDTSNIGALPAYTEESRAPMQAFYFSTGIGRPSCEEAPDLITIQGRDDILVDLTVNGADIRIGSTIHLRSLADNRIAFSVSEGHLEILETGQRVEEGETVEGRIDDFGTIEEWDDPRETTEEEQGYFGPPQRALEDLFGPTVLEDGSIVHIVRRGETVFSIAELYQAAMAAIIERNELDPEGDILIGQRLIIPAPGSGFVALPPPRVDTPVPTRPPAPRVDCSNFKPTSPLNGLAYGQNVFYWDAAPGASNYRVNVFNGDSGQGLSGQTAGTETNLALNLTSETIGFGYNFSWNVQALLNGNVVCEAGPVNLLRADPGSGAVAGASLSGRWYCSGQVLITEYSGADAGEPVYFNVITPNGATTLTGTGPSGSFSLQVGRVGASQGFLYTLIPNTRNYKASFTLTPAFIQCP